MASIIRIKRSEVSGNPSTLAQGEMAYSALADSGSNGGDRLYIGMGTETAGNAVNHIVIGGKYFTDKLDHELGTLTANSAILVDANSKIDVLNIDNITIDGNTISTTNANGNLVLDPNGTGLIDASATRITNVADPVNAQDVVTKNYLETTAGETIQDYIGAALTGGTQSGITVTYDDDSGTVDFNVSDPVITISGDVDGYATMTDLGDVEIAVTLDTVNANVGTWGDATHIPTFTVNGKGLITAAGEVSVATTLSTAAESGTGSVSLLTETLTIAAGDGIDTVASGTTITISGELATYTNRGIASYDSTDFTVTAGAVAINTITLGSTGLNPGETVTDLDGLTSLDVDNINIDGNKISSTDTDGNIQLDPNGTGTVDVSGARITSLAEPIGDTDAATKYYVDAARSGLDVKQSVRVATVGQITLSGTQTIDGIPLSVGDRVLVKDQGLAEQNGIWVVAETTWARATDADNTPSGEVTSGMFTFVEEGNVNDNCGFVLTTNDPISLDTTELDFALFSASGTLIAGDGLSKDGYTLKVNTKDGIDIDGDSVRIAPSAAGAGLTYTSGVIDVVGTANRITVAADSIDIASTYVGQTSITTLGTITTGTWNADTITVPNGGTGLTSVTARGVLYGNGTAALGIAAGATIDGSFLKQDGTGNPYFSNQIDGGTY